jgi:hypothetical protein
MRHDRVIVNDKGIYQKMRVLSRVLRIRSVAFLVDENPVSSLNKGVDWNI